MFCPGISLDADGNIVVTGGNDSKNTSTYHPARPSWVGASQMVIARGYQSSATLGDGRVFTIGGSWSGGTGGKVGEIYSPATDKWTLLPGCDVTPMLTKDNQGVYRSDNHAWLFAYKNNSVFQAGPSRQMNWYDVGGKGSYKGAGSRAADGDSSKSLSSSPTLLNLTFEGTRSSNDRTPFIPVSYSQISLTRVVAVCGVAVMFDAVSGSILSAGGSPSYQDSNATPNAHLIQLGDVGAAPTVIKLPSMKYARAFHNSALLPDGTVLVVGGQSYPVPFTDTTPAFPAELFDPKTRTWRTLASIAVPRTYHSIALLLPDATVLSGGGGLCGTGCQQNHFDMQVFSPPYLFKADGTRASRPTISSVSATEVVPGDSLTITTAQDVASFSLVRYGSATHSVNTDQRRVPLTPASVVGRKYSVNLPSEPGVLVPGYWMLFAIDSAGVPSVATTIRVSLD